MDRITSKESYEQGRLVVTFLNIVAFSSLIQNLSSEIQSGFGSMSIAINVKPEANILLP